MGLKILMIKAGLTQKTLAEKIGTYQQKVSYWLNGGQPDYYYIPKIAEATGATIADVVYAIIDN